VITTSNAQWANEMYYFEWRLQYFAGGITEHLQALPSALLPAHGTFLTAFAGAFAMLRLLAFGF
jgi:hypothetical protein